MELTVQFILVVISASKISDIISGGGGIKVTMARGMLAKQTGDNDDERCNDLHFRKIRRCQF